MIVISHAQARRLIAEALDARPIPAEQWSALQAHLEACAECRAYRDQMLALEKALRRDLHLRWSGAFAPGALPSGSPASGTQPRRLTGTARAVIAKREHRARRGHWFRRAAVYLLAFALMAGYIAYRRSLPPPVRPKAAIPVQTTPTSNTMNPTATYLAANPASLFQGVVAFSAPGQDGAPDIFLLRQDPSGSELDNLTRNPGFDTDPAWSPDGQWLAFISTRDGTAQIYVISVAGTRLTRLTSDPHLAWTGPLSWSADGRWIAATASQQVTGPTSGTSDGWLYRVAWDGSAPERIPGGRGGRFARFAPTGDRLAFQVSATLGANTSWGLRVYDERTGSTRTVASTLSASQPVSLSSTSTAPSLDLPSIVTQSTLTLSALTLSAATPSTPTPSTDTPLTVLPGAYDWSADGRGIVYLDRLADGSTEIRAVRDLDVLMPVTGNVQTGMLGEEIYSATPESTLYAGWSPENELLYAQLSAGMGANGCALLSSFTPRGGGPGSSSLRQTAPVVPSFPPLCLTGGFDRSSWSADGRWLIVSARQGTSAAGIFAVSVPDQSESNRMATVDRLTDLPPGSGPLRVRPDRPAALSGSPDLQGPVPLINPRPGASLPVAQPPPNLLSRVVITRFSETGNTLARLNANGVQVSLPAGRLGFCSRSAPPGGASPSRIAFVAFRNSLQPNRSDIFVMDPAGQRAVQITRGQDFPLQGIPGQRLSELARYDCPVWSPDGGALAAWVETDTRRFLAILPIPVEGYPGANMPARSPVRQARYIPVRPAGTQPVWSPDGEQVLAASLNASGWPQIVRYQAASGQPIGTITLDGWNTVPGMDFAPADAVSVLSDEKLAYAIGRATSTGGWMTDLRIATIGSGHADSAGQLANSVVGAPTPETTASLGSSVIAAAVSAASLPGSDVPDPNLGYSGLTWLNRPGEQWLGLIYHASPTERTRTALLLYDFNEHKLHTLLTSGSYLQAVAWSPDGNWLIYSTPAGMYALSIPGALAGTTAPAWLSDETATDLDWR